MSNRLAAAAVALVVALTASSAAHAAEARPPIGSWVGAFPDGSTVELVVQANGNCMYGIPGQAPAVGTASWRSTSATGGILTITYFNAGFENHLYYSVVWVSARSFVLSDPYFRVVMQAR